MIYFANLIEIERAYDVERSPPLLPPPSPPFLFIQVVKNATFISLVY